MLQALGRTGMELASPNMFSLELAHSRCTILRKLKGNEVFFVVKCIRNFVNYQKSHTFPLFCPGFRWTGLIRPEDMLIKTAERERRERPREGHRGSYTIAINCKCPD